MNNGLTVALTPLDADHLRARLHWREQDTGGGEINVEAAVRSPKADRKSESELRSDASALATRLARAFAGMLDS